MKKTVTRLSGFSNFAITRDIEVDKKNQLEMEKVLREELQHAGCSEIELVGWTDHVHCLYTFLPVHSYAGILRYLKSYSSTQIMPWVFVMKGQSVRQIW